MSFKCCHHSHVYKIRKVRLHIRYNMNGVWLRFYRGRQERISVSQIHLQVQAAQMGLCLPAGMALAADMLPTYGCRVLAFIK